MISTPPKPPEDRDVLASDQADALFAATQDQSGDARNLAILGGNDEILYATPAALRLFGAESRAAFERLMAAGDGPIPRRLRHLAATLPVGGPARLEQFRFFHRRRPTGLNLLCARVPVPGGGTVLTLSTPESQSTSFPGSDAQRGMTESPAAVSIQAEPSRRSRFLWTLDSDCRFGATDPLLAAALGGTAPRPGETLEQLRLRAVIEHSDELAALIGRRETFTGLALAWGRSGDGRKLRLTLSATPSFDSLRAFAGFRGFGVLDHPRDLPTPAGIEPMVEPAVLQVPPADTAISEEAVSSARLKDDPSISAQDEADDGGKSSLAPSEGADADSIQPAAHQERTAEIYFLRQVAAGALKVVPIRPKVTDTLAPREAQGSGESVELSRSERDAFREIAQALVGRPQALRQDEEAELPAPVDEVEDESAEASDDPLSRTSLPDGAGSGVVEMAWRNAAALLDRLPVGILVARDASALYLNRTLLDLLDYRDLETFETSDGLAKMFRGHGPQSVRVEDHSPLSVVKADGSALAVEGHARVVLWGGAPATLFSLRPSTEAELEDKLRHAERETPAPSGSAADLQEMLDLATDGAVVLDAAGRILSFNLPAERLFGYEQREVVGESVLMLLAPPSHLETTAAARPPQSQRKSARTQSAPRRRRPEPARRSAHSGADRCPDRLAGGVFLLRPVSGHAAASSRRRPASLRPGTRPRRRMPPRPEFLAQVTHEIRTPLHAILGFAEVMMEERFGPIGNDRYRDYLKDIHASGMHVISLADDLLDLSKIEAGKLELDFALVDANSLIRECVSLMQPQAARERVIMRVSLFDRLPRVMVDERSLKQMMLNLMSNAVKFNEPGGQVIVSTAVDPRGRR